MKRNYFRNKYHHYYSTVDLTLSSRFHTIIKTPICHDKYDENIDSKQYKLLPNQVLKVKNNIYKIEIRT